MSCQTSHKNDEFLLSVFEDNATIIYLYRTRYISQRDLLVQTILLAKDFHEKRASNIPLIRNPNEKYPEENCRSPLGKVRNSALKLVINDRYIPPRSLLKVVVFEKVSFPGFNKKFHLIVGHANLILSRFLF